jgi:hypothetical protein
MNDKVRQRSKNTNLPCKIDEKTTVLESDELTIREVPKLSLNEFMETYDDDYSNDEKRLMYLKGYEGMSFEESARIMTISKTRARELGKKLEHEISNISIERSIEIKRYFNSSRRDVEITDAMVLGELQKVIMEKVTNSKELLEMPLEKLLKLQGTYSEKSTSSGDVYTGRSLPKVKFPSVDETISIEY